MQLNLKKSSKQNTNPVAFQEKLQQYPEYVHMYTDASKDSDRVGCAVIFDNATYNK